MALGDPNGQELVDQMLSLGLISDGSEPPAGRANRRFVISRSGLEVAGIASVAAWVARHLAPTLVNRWMVPVYGAILLVGVFALLQGEPPGPAVSSRPALDAMLGVAIALTYSFIHELSHAVALVRYGRKPRRAGLGFYWGAISYFVDSSDALTLPRAQRIRQAVVGLFCDALAISVLASVAQFTSSTFLAAVCWRVALIACLELVVNSLPFLEVDGHWALSDALDEPELAPRSRAALGSYLSRNSSSESAKGAGLACYGAFSLMGGIGLLVGAGFIWWHAAGELVTALLSGTTVEFLVGLYVLIPFSLGVLFSSLGLVLDLFPPSSSD